MLELKGIGAALAVPSETGSQSIYTVEEVSTFARIINEKLKDEATLSERLPMNPDNEDLFDTCSDGLVLIYLI